MNLYLKERGLAIDYYKELPGVISKNPEEIFESIEDKPYDMNALQRFKAVSYTHLSLLRWSAVCHRHKTVLKSSGHWIFF